MSHVADIAVVDPSGRSRRTGAGGTGAGEVGVIAGNGREPLSRLVTDVLVAAGHAPRAAAPESAAFVLDLSGRHRPLPGQVVWRFEAADGRDIVSPLALSGVWHRPPYAVAIRLVRDDRTLAVAHVGTLGPYAAFRDRVAAMAAILLRQALARGDDDGVPSARTAGHRDGLLALGSGWLRFQAARWRARLFVEWWTVGVVDRPIAEVVRAGGLGPVGWLRPDRGTSYWADPFAWSAAGRVLCEEFPIGGGAGVIAVLREQAGVWERESVLPADGTWADGRHRSYPSTFVENGWTYLLPECVGGGATRVYRLDAAGGVTEVSVVSPSALADATLFSHQGRYWVAATDPAIGPHDNLCLFHAERLDGPWQPHRGNPVKLDIRSSRPGGTPFLADGKLYRPAQDCAAAYGAAVVINEVLTLTTDTFAERQVLRLGPDRAGRMPDGLHTISAFGARTLVDGKRMVPAPGLALRRLAGRVRGAGRGRR